MRARALLSDLAPRHQHPESACQEGHAPFTARSESMALPLCSSSPSFSRMFFVPCCGSLAQALWATRPYLAPRLEANVSKEWPGGQDWRCCPVVLRVQLCARQAEGLKSLPDEGTNICISFLRLGGAGPNPCLSSVASGLGQGTDPGSLALLTVLLPPCRGIGVQGWRKETKWKQLARAQCHVDDQSVHC